MSGRCARIDACTGPTCAWDPVPQRDHQARTLCRSSRRTRTAHHSTVPPSSRRGRARCAGRVYLAQPDLPEVAEHRGTPDRVSREDGVVIGARVHLDALAEQVDGLPPAAPARHGPDTKTLTVAHGSCPTAEARSRRIPSTLTSSPSQSSARRTSAPSLPFPRSPRNAPTAPCGSRSAQGLKYAASASAVPAPIVTFAVVSARTGASESSRRIARRSDNTRWRRATPDADLATKRAGCHWPSCVGNSRCGKTSSKNPAVSAKESSRLRNKRPDDEFLGGCVAATVVRIDNLAGRGNGCAQGARNLQHRVVWLSFGARS